jgi:hypothetical protein
VLLGADTKATRPQRRTPRSASARRRAPRVIADKNARIGEGVRLVNEGLVQEFNGNGFFIETASSLSPKMV